MTKQQLRQAIHGLRIEIKSTENLIDRELIHLENARMNCDYLVYQLKNLNETDERQNSMSETKDNPKLIAFLQKQAHQSDFNGEQARRQLEQMGIEVDYSEETESSIRMSKIGNVAKFPELGLRNKPFELAINERVTEPYRGGSKYPAFESVKESFLKQV